MECSDADGSRHTEIVLRRGCLVRGVFFSIDIELQKHCLLSLQGHQEKLDSSSWISTVIR